MSEAGMIISGTLYRQRYRQPHCHNLALYQKTVELRITNSCSGRNDGKARTTLSFSDDGMSITAVCSLKCVMLYTTIENLPWPALQHVASNRYTGYTPHPTPAQIAASIELQRRARAFLRRELRVWINLDLEFLMNYIIALIKTLDLRSEAGIKLLADLMDPGNPYSEETRKPNTEHLAHGDYRS
jgi:hypothetical protein